MTDFIQSLTEEQMNELQELRRTHKDLLNQLTMTFSGNCKYYGDNTYGMFGIFSDSPVKVSQIYQYKYLKGLNELMSK